MVPAHEQRERNIRTLVSYIGNRIAQSETLYHVGRKQRVLGEWRRITTTHTHAKADLLEYFNERPPLRSILLTYPLPLLALRHR